MSESIDAARQLSHHHIAMRGREINEARSSSPLELLFDLTFALGIGLSAAQLAHLLSLGHWLHAILGFAFAVFAVCWAWTNYSWFSSAYDTDDWKIRLATLVQMVGVVVLSLGIPNVFASIETGSRLDNGIMVLGYVIMRLAMVSLWILAARQDASRRYSCVTYAINILLAQIGWVTLTMLKLDFAPSMIGALLLTALEFSGPLLAERKNGGTPWNAHHIADRYSSMAIIGLGEGVVGTVSAVTAVVDHQGWNTGAIELCAIGLSLTFGMWWMYFLLPSAEVLHRFRNRSFGWGYSHIIVFAAIAGVGAGLQVAGYYLQGKAEISAVAVTWVVALPVAIYVAMIYGIYVWLVRSFDRFHFMLLLASALLLIAAITLAHAGFALTVSLAMLALIPAINVIGYEVIGYRRHALVLEKLAESREQ